MSFHEKEEARQTLNKISIKLNLLDGNNATGDLHFRLEEPQEDGQKWKIYVEGTISDGQDNDGRELWKSSELDDLYSGDTITKVIENILSDVKKYYGITIF